MFGQGIYGCENRKRKGGIASSIDYLCKIEISKYMRRGDYNLHHPEVFYFAENLFGSVLVV